MKKSSIFIAGRIGGVKYLEVWGFDTLSKSFNPENFGPGYKLKYNDKLKETGF